jgi:hypothetical protein
VVRGVAQRDLVTKHFSWTVRLNVELFDCGYLDEVVSHLELVGGQRSELHLEMRGEQLFRDTSSDDGELRFDAFAAADANGDGNITLEELAQMDAPAEIDVAALELDIPSQLETDALTLADVVYWLQWSALPRVAGAGRCRIEVEGF